MESSYIYIYMSKFQGSEVEGFNLLIYISEVENHLCIQSFVSDCHCPSWALSILGHRPIPASLDHMITHIHPLNHSIYSPCLEDSILTSYPGIQRLSQLVPEHFSLLHIPPPLPSSILHLPVSESLLTLSPLQIPLLITSTSQCPLTFQGF